MNKVKQYSKIRQKDIGNKDVAELLESLHTTNKHLTQEMQQYKAELQKNQRQLEELGKRISDIESRF